MNSKYISRYSEAVNNDVGLPIDRTKQIRCTNIIIDGRRKGEICNKMFCIGDIGHGGAIEHLCPRCKQACRIMKIP